MNSWCYDIILNRDKDIVTHTKVWELLNVYLKFLQFHLPITVYL